MPKVFCIGFHKTGTTSLHEALAMLGYRVCSVRKDLVGPLLRGEAGPIEAVLQQYDAFEDNPWPLLYRVLDEAVPGARFILTVRDVDAWYDSALSHFGARVTPMRQLIYGRDHGAPLGKEQVYKERFERHYADVRAHFAGRDDLLELDLARGEGWDALCGFLGHPVPDVPFPHANHRGDRRPPRISAPAFC